MGGIILLIALCVVMAMASFLAGALPLSMTLSQSQLRLISSIGVGVLVGTSLIVIIPEGIQAAAAPAESSHLHRTRTLARRIPWARALDIPAVIDRIPTITVPVREHSLQQRNADVAVEEIVVTRSTATMVDAREGKSAQETPRVPDDKSSDKEENHEKEGEGHEETPHGEHIEIPTFEIGFSLILGFILMFLIDRLPRHATETLQSTPQTHHMSLDNLGGDSSSVDEEADGFLGSLTPSPRRARSLATTVGLVIHAAADGIAMGASSTSSDTKLGFIIFLAIMIHKAPAAFGLTSVLLKQGLSKRAARGHLIIFSLAAPVGALSTWMLITLLGGSDMKEDSGTWWTGMLLLFSGGTFLYVAMHAMQEDGSSPAHEQGSGLNGYADGNSINQRKAKGPQMRDTLATTAGMLLPLLTQFGHHH